MHSKAFMFQRRDWSSVYFIVDYDKIAVGKQVVEAYFTLSHKAIELKGTVSKSQRKRIWGGVINDDPIAHFVLIGHMGKYISPEYISPISAGEILRYAWEIIAESHDLITFTSVLVECRNEPKLIERYTENGFVYLQEDDLVQMIRRV